MNTSRYIIMSLLKILSVIVLIVVLFIIGLLIGYGTIGNGQAMDILKIETWNHIFAYFKTE